MKQILYLFVAGVLMAAVGNSVGIAQNAHQEPLVFTTPIDEGVFTQYQREVLKEVSNRTGIKCTLKELPKKRCLVATNKGVYAGVAARIKGLEKDYQNLRMIRVSHFTVQHILFAKKKNIIETVNDINTLTEHVIKTDCVVGFLRGSKKAQSILSDIPEKKKVVLDSPKEAFKLININRIGAYLAGPGIVNRSILKKQFNQNEIKEVCVLAETQLFPYVHEKYAYVIPILESTLRSMVAEGTLDRIRKALE
ncbi:MAG: transporter substrate-binding domain-containing protein [Desulfobacter sp.]|nr:MAG: transporter substrate-binding domain-containing protein [Desulfobacter sp.]